ncbi:cytochrome P450 [Penicillium macrosclerotiorum]|uniref:cytochrome P450 n=1 Tax=Penicillium macrosclerotiorum TaxID=303699 RepID=UPI002547F58A|nr:cytochrome P450 [Penicillium macrosclerotiorum]KAJ5692009.1 cytochrome P450 [Penicillium macrosclerotiorum]
MTTGKSLPQVLDIRRTRCESIISHDIRDGIRREPRTLPIMILYSEEGLRHWDRHCHAPEYYLFHEELRILRQQALSMAEAIEDNSVVVDFGSASAWLMNPTAMPYRSLDKTILLLEALETCQKQITYYALDLNKAELVENLKLIPIDNFRYVRCSSLHGTFDDGLEWLKHTPDICDRPHCILFLGSTIGNFSRKGATSFLSQIALQALTGSPARSSIFLTVDRCKLPSKVLRAYNSDGCDSFTLTGLQYASSVLKEESPNECNGTTFCSDDWHFVSEWNCAQGRHESSYTPKSRDVRLGPPLSDIVIKKGEKVRFAYSHKYDECELRNLFAGAGLRNVKTWTANGCDLAFFQLKLDPNKQLHLLDTDAHRKYGPIFRAAPNYVMVNDPAYIHEAHKWNRTDWFITLDPQYSLDSAYEMESLIDSSVMELIQILRDKFALTGNPCDISDHIHWFAFDTIMELAFSHRVGFLKNGKDVQFIIGSLMSLFGITRLMTTFPGLQKFINHRWVSPILGPKTTDQYGPGLVRGIAIQEVQGRLRVQNPTQTRDLLQRFLEYKDPQGRGTPTKDLEVEAFTPVIAGPESVATVLRIAVLYIISTPHVYRKLVEELDSQDRSGTLSSPITFREAKSLPYLSALVKEVFRIHPPIGALEHHSHVLFHPEAPKSAAIISRQGVSTWALGRNKTIFGEDVDRFRPERWLEASRAVVREYEKADLTFGAGLTTCLGKHIALFEI